MLLMSAFLCDLQKYLCYAMKYSWKLCKLNLKIACVLCKTMIEYRCSKKPQQRETTPVGEVRKDG